MTIIWSDVTESYHIDTGEMFGTISPFGWYHGLSGLVHQSDRMNLVKPSASFLNAEYYIRPGAGRKMLPRAISGERKTTHELCGDTVVLRFPPEPEYALGLSLAYSVRGDTVDMSMTINPTMDVADFEIFFASYVCEALGETWVPLRGEDGSREWAKLQNRSEMNAIFGIMRDTSLLGLLPAEYPDMPVNEQDRPFSEPILAARNPISGLALVFLCDPHVTKCLAGQYHGWDTAHDWSYGADLKAGTEVEAQTRLICRTFGSAEEMWESVIRLWGEFVSHVGDS
jgi:hypothetical protein